MDKLQFLILIFIMVRKCPYILTVFGIVLQCDDTGATVLLGSQAQLSVGNSAQSTAKYTMLAQSTTTWLAL